MCVRETGTLPTALAPRGERTGRVKTEDKRTLPELDTQYYSIDSAVETLKLVGKQCLTTLNTI